MFDPDLLRNPHIFSKTLFEKMQAIQVGIADLELYEFRYGLAELIPAHGWDSISLDPIEVIEQRVGSRGFYDRIQIKPIMGNRMILDPECARLTQMLFVGLVVESYSPEWIRSHFYFDIRGFYFLHRTTYFTEKVLAHFGGEPLVRFEPKQRAFEKIQDVGYKAFREANAEVDAFFIHSVLKLIAARGTPVLVAIAGPTAAGKTEIAERIRSVMEGTGKNVTSVELDNFLTDRDDREQRGIHSEGKEALHFGLLKNALADLISGKVISIPRYDFVYATSSHDLNGNLKPDGVPIVINPADIIFMEGNFPFLLEEIAPLIGIKIVYLTDDPIRLKRKWKRDVDYRKKYELNYFRNRYFKDQFIMAEIAYLPQMETCDITVDTTGAAIWVTPAVREILSR
jgi:uridine kinase